MGASGENPFADTDATWLLEMGDKRDKLGQMREVASCTRADSKTLIEAREGREL